jgi:hypothetical protein
VEGAEAPDEVDGVDADDLAGGEASGDGVEGDAVVGIVEGGDKDKRVGDVEVGVAGGQALAFEDDGRGHGEGNDLEWLARSAALRATAVALRDVGGGGAAEGVEAVEVLGQREMVLVGGIVLDAREDGVFGDEAGDVVDVSVRIVARAAAMQPEGLVDAEVIAEGCFEQVLRRGFVAEAGVAHLDLGEQALLGGEENARAVGVDGAAFEDDTVGLITPTRKFARRGPRFGLRIEGSGRDNGLDLRDAVETGHVVRNFVVKMPVRVLGPGVELPVGDGEVVLLIFNKDRAGVAKPDTVGGPVVEVEAGEVGSAAAEDASGAALCGRVVDQDVDVFDAGEIADDLCIDPWDGLKLAGPVVRIVGPGDPGGGVMLPLGGHTGWGGGHGATRVTRSEVR